MLEKVYDQVKDKKKGSILWKLKGISEVGFYNSLHNFLKHWPKAHSAPKMEMGKFYIAIDKNLQEKEMHLDNAYQFVEKLITSSLPRNTVVNYNLEKDKVKVLESEVKQCNDQIQKLTEDFAAMKLQLEDTKKSLTLLSIPYSGFYLRGPNFCEICEVLINSQILILKLLVYFREPATEHFILSPRYPRKHIYS